MELNTLTDALWTPWLLGAFLLFGLLLSLKTGFFQLFRLPLWWKSTFGSLFSASASQGGLSSVQALATALASTVGTGSIAGVATALTLGGPGAIFWLWLCAFLSMMIGCVEKILTVRYQCTGADGAFQGGPMFYLRDGLHAPRLAFLFCLICLPATLTGGNLIQASAMADALEHSLGIDRLLTGMVAAILVGIAMSGGVQRIAKLSTLLVPVMAVLYLGSGLWILLTHLSALPKAFACIFSCALSPSCALSGAGGWSVSCAIRYGVARGVFTNEAGLGTSAIAHGAACVSHPARQGMWGIFEVFCSSFLVCTITALVILVSGVYPDTDVTGIGLTSLSFQRTLGPAGGHIVTFSLLLFAFSSLLGWSYYGQQALRFLTGGDRWLTQYRLVFLGCIVAGSVWNADILWQLVDLFNALLALPNLFALLRLHPEALQLLRQWERIKNPLRKKAERI